MIKVWHDEAWEDYIYLQTQDRKMLKRVNKILKDIERDNYFGIGKPERLKGDLAGYMSRRIDDKNRIVYRIVNNTLEIAQCGSHYKDK